VPGGRPAWRWWPPSFVMACPLWASWRHPLSLWPSCGSKATPLCDNKQRGGRYVDKEDMTGSARDIKLSQHERREAHRSIARLSIAPLAWRCTAQQRRRQAENGAGVPVEAWHKMTRSARANYVLSGISLRRQHRGMGNAARCFLEQASGEHGGSATSRARCRRQMARVICNRRARAPPRATLSPRYLNVAISALRARHARMFCCHPGSGASAGGQRGERLAKDSRG